MGTKHTSGPSKRARATAAASAMLPLLITALATLYECDDITPQPTVQVGKYYALRGTHIPYTTAHVVPNITVSWADAEPTKFYAVAMVDPDAPSPKTPKLREIRHWLVGNIRGDALATGDFSGGEVLSTFRNPSPPQGSGYHRYVQLIFLQNEKRVSWLPLPTSIAKWNVTNWAAVEQLHAPVACNYFETEYGSKR